MMLNLVTTSYLEYALSYRGLLDAFVEGCQDIAEHLENAPPGPITVQAACALLQNPLLEDPEHDWYATIAQSYLSKQKWRESAEACIAHKDFFSCSERLWPSKQSRTSVLP